MSTLCSQWIDAVYRSSPLQNQEPGWPQGQSIFPWDLLGDLNGAVAVSSAGECGPEEGEAAWQRSRSCLVMFAWSVHIKGDSRIYGLKGKEVAWAGGGLEIRNNEGLLAWGLQLVE